MLPRLMLVKQEIPAPEINNIEHEAWKALYQLNINPTKIRGLKIGITVGSRGIFSLVEILKVVINFVNKAGGKPIVIPAMGSHGGGTKEGQEEILKSMGICEESVGAPIYYGADAILLGSTETEIPVYSNPIASKMDGLIIINRIKPHTDFSGNIESGICKMLTIGLGNPTGAQSAHTYALEKGFVNVISEVSMFLLQKLPVLFALAIMENWQGRTAAIRGILPANILTKEAQLLKKVKSSTIKIPFKKFDILVVKEIGKNISGTGMDTKAIGRIRSIGQKEPKYPQIGRVVALNLTNESHGNATGIGLADFTTRSVLKKIDFQSTSLNSISSMAPEQGRLPCVLENDYKAIKTAICSLGARESTDPRLVYIKNTSRLGCFAVSESMISEIRSYPWLTIMGGPAEMEFDSRGNLLNYSNEF